MNKIAIFKSDELDVIEKAWGEEVIINNGYDYCGKILRFRKGGMFSMHFHVHKSESWYVNKGEFIMDYIDPETAIRKTVVLTEGMVVDIPKYQPHKLYTLDGGEIFEVSSQHFDDDSYRVEKGDSQR